MQNFQQQYPCKVITGSFEDLQQNYVVRPLDTGRYQLQVKQDLFPFELLFLVLN